MGEAVSPPRVAMRGISKNYSGVHALTAVDLTIQVGEVHALIGENGAGKSTLVKILTGVVHPDDGEIAIDGQPQVISDPIIAHRLGIAAMYQEPTVFLDLTVAENIFAGRRPRGRAGAVDWRAMRQQAQVLLDDLNVDFGTDTPVRGLSVADRQMLEIAKALSADARLLIMDEPTASLSPNEVDNLFSTVRQLRERGVAILFISHRLEEVSAIADAVTILRDGHHIATELASRLTQEDMVQLMVGRSIEQLFPKQTADIGDPVLEVEHFTRKGVFNDVTFQVRRGEIVGFAGFVGAGRSEVAWSLFGIEPHDAGDVTINGALFVPSTPLYAMQHGLAYLPEDRLSQGLVPTMPVTSNVVMAVLRRLTPQGFLQPWVERQLTKQFVERLHIKAAALGAPVQSLSGGNQQKVVLSKWLAVEPQILILDEPTRGVDVGTKADVYQTISSLAAQGLAIMLISSELPEILGMSDRVLVMREGRLVAEFQREDATEQKIVAAAAGVSVSELEKHEEEKAFS